MSFDANWFDLSWRHGVLELPEALTAPGLALELHVERVDKVGTVAWWCTETGELLAVVEVGSG